jgi:enoyl-CoA hydratase/carnithine racemase
MSKISLICKDNIAYLVLNRAEKHNALTQSMWQQIAEACDKLVQEIKPRVLIIESTSNKAFSAGAGYCQVIADTSNYEIIRV